MVVFVYLCIINTLCSFPIVKDNFIIFIHIERILIMYLLWMNRDRPIDIKRSVIYCEFDNVFIGLCNQLICPIHVIYTMSGVHNSLGKYLISWIGGGNLIHVFAISVFQDRIIRQYMMYDILG